MLNQFYFMIFCHTHTDTLKVFEKRGKLVWEFRANWIFNSILGYLLDVPDELPRFTGNDLLRDDVVVGFVSVT